MQFLQSVELPMSVSCVDQRPAVLTGPLTVLFATAVGVIVTNLFAPQTLVGLIGPSLGFDDAANGLVAMATLLGYAGGLFLLVPLADLLENRKLVIRMLGCAIIAAGFAALAPSGPALLVILFVLGAACSAIQVLVPIAASMVPPERQGQVIGDVMSGLMVGILLSRPVASLLADAWGWRMFYAVSAAAMALLTALLTLRLPRRKPMVQTSYPALITSLWHLLRSEPVLRQRALTASLVMAAFSVFWTSVALRLAQPPYGLDQRGIALFALAGAAGAVVTPLAGRAGDRGWTRPATVASHLVLIAALALAAWTGSLQSVSSWMPLVLMVASAILLDVGVIGDQTLGRRAINLLHPEARGRMNGLFVGLFFLGGALGSPVAGVAWASAGWTMTCGAGAAFGIAALIADAVTRP
jgi:predicted MFS family arabinose efflux permease